MDLGRLIDEKIKSAIGKKASKELSEGLKDLGTIDIPKIIDDALKGKKSPEIEKLEKLGASFDKKKMKKLSKVDTDEET